MIQTIPLGNDLATVLDNAPNQVDMHHELKRIELEPLPEATVVYVPETETLYIESGQLREDAEEMADGVLVYYNTHDEASAVALCIEPAEQVLKPFVDAILVKYGVKPGSPPVANETEG